MKRNGNRALHSSKSFSFTPVALSREPRLDFTEQALRAPVAELEERIVHHCDRPEIEVRILHFIAEAHGPSSHGVAEEMGVSPEAAEFHLRELRRAGRIWGQSVRGQEMSWHISLEGRHFLAERGRLV